MADDFTAETIPFWDEVVGQQTLNPFSLGAADPETIAATFGGATGPTFLDDVSPWDCVFLNDKPLPGLCAVETASELQIDQQKGPKNDGAKLVLHGFIPGPVDISVTLWTPAQWRGFLEFMPVLLRKPNKDSKELAQIAKAMKISKTQAKTFSSVISVAHPALDMLQITRVVVKGISTPRDGTTVGTKVIKIRCLNYVAPTNRTTPSKTTEVGVHEKVQKKPAKNEGGEAPSKTGSGPRGHAKDRTPGST